VGKNHLEVVTVDAMVILKCIFGKCDGGAWNGLLWFRAGTGGGRL